MWCGEAPEGGGARGRQGYRLTQKVAEGLRTGAVSKEPVSVATETLPLGAELLRQRIWPIRQSLQVKSPST